MHPVFPHFAKLTLEDKDKYNQLVEEYTPFSDFSFTTLHIWWNLDDKLSFSTLNKNLVINYSQPFDSQGSGLCLVGRHEIDESIATLFSFLKEKGAPTRLVHVPEFVVERIQDKTSLLIDEEPDMHEYIMDAQALANLEGGELGRIRRKVSRFLRETEGKQLNLQTLDLSSEANRNKILENIFLWQKKYSRSNDPKRSEELAIPACLSHHSALDIRNLCLFVDGELQSVALYHLSHDKRYLILNHLKVDYEIPFIFDYMTQQVAQKAVDENVQFLNMEMDLGIEGLRKHKMGLRPVKFLNKYSVEPA